MSGRPLGLSRGRLGWLLEVLGGILGGLGDLLGGLGGLLGHLGVPWVDFCRFKHNKVRWGAELGSIWEHRMAQRGTKKAPKTEDKNKDDKRSF